MRPVWVYLSYAAACVGFFAVAQTAPAPPAGEAHALHAGSVQISRFAERANLEQALAQGRPPVPFMRESELSPYVPLNAVEPSVVVAVAGRPPAIAEPALAASSESNAYRSVRITADARWRAAARNGSTELAVTATP